MSASAQASPACDFTMDTSVAMARRVSVSVGCVLSVSGSDCAGSIMSTTARVVRYSGSSSRHRRDRMSPGRVGMAGEDDARTWEKGGDFAGLDEAALGAGEAIFTDERKRCGEASRLAMH